ncbi:MAG: DUF2796 domain-containing protein [Roseovarius sp.]|nr:DUF2796 domain-containing protein [Roseovarius sp.]
MKHAIPIILTMLAQPVIAGETRELDAHEHGVGELNIAVEGDTIAMELHAPGADIVGFEYAAKSAEDRAAIDGAVAALAKPLELFVFPASAQCSVTQASAELESDDHEHEDHADEGAHEEHDDHDDHDDGEHADADVHDDHEEHAEGASHTEFHAEYTLTCGNLDDVSKIEFAYFDVFSNARELEVQILTSSGAQAYDVERGDPTLDLRGMF